MIDKTLPFLPELGYSFDLNVHKGICECYSKLLDLYEEDRLFSYRAGSAKRILARSINRYVDNVLCTKREKICPDIQRLLMFLSKNDCEEQTLKVEEELCLIFQKQKDFPVSRLFRPKYILQQIALNSMDKLYIYPLQVSSLKVLVFTLFIMLVKSRKSSLSLHTLSRLCRNVPEEH